ncbi:L-threonylcarbamoyladenylate synthase, partial [Chloroflexota bacterium]
MQTKILQANSPGSIEKAVKLLRGDNLVAFPTDTVYGLGALAYNAGAIEKLYAAKGRETNKAIAVLVGNFDSLPIVTADMNNMASHLAHCFWPGPLTIVVSLHPVLPKNISSYKTVGVRMPDHPMALDLLNQTGPLAVTSANLSGQSNTSTAAEVFTQLAGRIPLILDGGCTPGGDPSTIIDCTGSEPVILRQ